MAEKTPTIIAAAHESFLTSNGGKPHEPKVIAEAKKALIDAEKAYEKAQKEAEAVILKARQKRHEAAAKMIAAVGAKVRVDLGEDYGIRTPSSRGDLLFYRLVGEVEEPVTV